MFLSEKITHTEERGLQSLSYKKERAEQTEAQVWKAPPPPLRK